MNCSTFRRNLLATDYPSAPTPPEGSHFVACPACSAWHRRLVRLEQRLPNVPVPACPVPASLLAQIRTPALRLAGGTRLAGHRRNLQGGRQKLALAFSLAASLAVFALGWWAWPHLETTRPVASAADSLEVRIFSKIQHASTPVERAEALAGLAEEFLAEAIQKPNDPAMLAVLARDFERLVHEELMQHLRQVSPGERRNLALELSRRLGSIESKASRFAVVWQSRHSQSAAALLRIAASAREADRRLRPVG